MSLSNRGSRRYFTPLSFAFGLCLILVACAGSESTQDEAAVPASAEGPQGEQDEMGLIAYKVWYYVGLQRDVDLRNNEMDAYRQRAQALFADWTNASAWFDPELLDIPLDTVKGWMDTNLDLGLYRFAIEDLYRQQAHVLDEKGEELLALGSRFRGSPSDIYAMLSTADVDWPMVTLSNGDEVQVSTAQYYSKLQTSRVQSDREAVWRAFFGTYDENINTYASIYKALCQRDWSQAQSRGYATTLEAALDGNNIPTAVVENLIAVAKEGAGPLQRYFDIRGQVLGLETVAIYDGYVSLVPDEKNYDYDEASEWVLESVEMLGKSYQAKMKEGFENRWTDVYETPGKRSGAYSAGVYGIHPYMLLNYGDALGDVFTLAHEMGHTMHTVLANENQPFVYSDYTIFVAEVASTFNEALLLEYLLERSDDPKERVLLLQRAIDQIAQTFYRQVCFADFELEAHRMVERGEPVTADSLNDLYNGLLKQYYGPNMDLDELYGITWSRIPHFFRSPYYVFQYATCFASSAQIFKAIQNASGDEKRAEVERYLDLLRSGGNDFPMEQLKRAGVDLSTREPVQAVVDQMDLLVTRLESEIKTIQAESR